MATKEKPVESDSTALGPLEIIRTDTVISRLPAHNLFGQGGMNIQLNKSDANGQTRLSWKVAFNSDVGEAGQLAYRIETLVINRHIDDAGRPVPTMIRLGSLSEICHQLGINPSGANSNSVKRALQQNAGALITANLSYKGSDGSKQKLEATFTKYSVAFRGDELPNGDKSDGVIILLNEQYRRVLNRAATRPLDFLYLKELTPSAQRFYEILSYQMYAALKHGYPEAKLLYSDYCAYSGQPRQASAVEMNKRMYKIHQPHLKSGYITKATYHPMRDADGATDWVMSYVPGPRARAEFERFNRKLYTEDHMQDLVTASAFFQSTDGQDVEERNDTGREAPPLIHRLLRQFHLLARGVKNYQPLPKGAELRQVKEVVQRLGEEGAWFFLEFAIGEARKTNFKMAQFGGAMQYLEAGALAWQQRQARPPAGLPPALDLFADQRAEEDLLVWAEDYLRALPEEISEALLQQSRETLLRNFPAAAYWGEDILRETVWAGLRKQVISENHEAGLASF